MKNKIVLEAIFGKRLYQVYRYIKDKRDMRRREQRYFEANLRGEYPLPPQTVKLAVNRHNIPDPHPRVFIETGTYRGDTVAAIKDMYPSVISVEVDETLFKNACVRFAADNNVHIVHGDCARVLTTILTTLHEPAVFWLDGHYSGGETGKGEGEDPILISLNQIAALPAQDHVIFVDDARTFDGREGRPDISDIFNSLKKTIAVIFFGYRMTSLLSRYCRSRFVAEVKMSLPETFNGFVDNRLLCTFIVAPALPHPFHTAECNAESAPHKRFGTVFFC
jgi:hypothetical protein